MKRSAKVTAFWDKYRFAVYSGIALFACYDPSPFAFVAFVALVPFLAGLQQVTRREAIRGGAILGAMFFGFQMFWLIPFIGKWTGNTGMAMIPWAISVLVQIPYFMLLAWLIWGAYRSQRPWLIPLLWAGIEVLRSYLPVVAFPHGHLATPLWFMPPMISLAGVGTIFLVSAWIVSINVAFLHVLTDSRSGLRFRTVQIAATLTLLAAGLYLVPLPSASKKIQVSLAQLGLDFAFGDPNTKPQRILESVNNTAAVAEQQKSDVAVFPEGLFGGGNILPPRYPFDGPRMPTIIGGQRGDGPVYQSTYAFDGKQWDVTDKTRLVIFGEFVPFRDKLGFLGGFNLPSSDLQAGSTPRTLKLGDSRVTSLVCFEGMFPDIPARLTAERPKWIAVVSLDDWFMGTPMMEQLLAAGAFRAVETGLPLVRVSSLGYTAAFDAKGTLLRKAPLGEQVVIPVQLNLPDETENRSWILWFPIVSLLVLVWQGINNLTQLRGIHEPLPTGPESKTKRTQ